jgi:ribosome-binding factor A
MEKGGAKHHRERMGGAIREELIVLVEGELGDPRIGLVSVTEVRMEPDGKTAHIWFNMDGDDDEAELSLEGLSAARQYIRSELTARLRLRQAPELIFHLARAQQSQSRIDELLHRIKKRNR